MHPARYEALSKVEDMLWWHRARRAVVARILIRAGIPKAARALDVGCGVGGAFRLFELLGVSTAVGIDLAWEALHPAKERWPGKFVVRADAAKPLPFRAESFDLVTVFGVLYHTWIPDDATTLRQLAALLKPDGLIVITEPAFPLLGRRMDEQAMTKRRYFEREITDMACSAGLEPVRTGYFAFTAFFPVLAVAMMERLFQHKPETHGDEEAYLPLDFRIPPRWLNRLLLALTNIEGRAIVSGFRFPFGVTVIGVYRRIEDGDASVF